jgi:hypothetical protein
MLRGHHDVESFLEEIRRFEPGRVKTPSRGVLRFGRIRSEKKLPYAGACGGRTLR